jgi:flagellar hook-associated protein 2
MSSVSSATSTAKLNITGLVSDTDWQGLVDNIIEAQQTAVTSPLNSKLTKQENTLSAWQSFNSTLSYVTSYIETYNLHKDSGYASYTGALSCTDSSITESDILSVSIGKGTLSAGTYEIEVLELASAEKLSSDPLAGDDTELALSGDLLINGNAITLETTDTLDDIMDKINDADIGVSASVVRSDSGYRLTLESAKTGSEGILLRNGGASDLLESLGLTTGVQLAHPSTGTASSDSFSDSTEAIGTVLGLTAAQSGTIQIMGDDDESYSVDIDLSTDSVQDIADAINNAGISGVTASVIETTEDDSTVYALQITGVDASDLTDSNNMLNTLGVLEGATKNAIRSGEDAVLSVDGYTVTSSSNTVTGVISGVALDLVGTNENSPITLTVERSTDAISDNLDTLVGYINDALSYIKKQNTYSEASDDETANILMGNSTLAGIKRSITSMVQGTIEGNSTYTTATSIGITVTSTGTISLDADALAAALSDNPDEVINAVKSFSSSLYDKLDVYVDPNTGTLVSIQNSVQSRIDNLEDRIEDAEDRFARKAEVLSAKYAALEVLISESDMLSSYLTQIVDSMTKSSD